MLRLIIKLFAHIIAPVSDKFYQALANPQAVQKIVQKEIIQRLVKSEYGNYLGIQSINDWEHIPIVEYEDIQKWINSGVSHKSLLTPEPIIFYEKTSGSRSAAKLIPYTKSLRKSFSQMFCVWAYDLIINGTDFSTGKIYFCISPKLGDSATTHQGVNVGLEDDSEYLDGWLRWLINLFIVSPPGINRICAPLIFKDKLAQTLLLEEDLEIISIWNPSFLKVHLDYIQANQQRLAEQLQNKISTERYQLLLEDKINWSKLWSELKLISCWDSVHAKEQANYLRSLFPNVMVQGKGLLATEAPMTIPLIKAQGCVPILNEVFFEFEHQGNIYHLHQLEKGKAYSIIISQKGGLYRYRIGDRIRVTHYYLETPCLEFLGRTETTSDLVGEKLHEDFVRDILNQLPLEKTFFQSLVPVRIPTDNYLLLLDQANLPAEIIAQLLDRELMRSHHYQQARLLGQLSPPQVLISEQIPEIITNYKIRQGMKWGDIKHQLLVTTPIDQELLNLLNYA
ncbi:MAG TPA: GH3 auxin-responsive promoter family protein [Oculatellaceae cyanobacterium]|jgi:hypothetical protein